MNRFDSTNSYSHIDSVVISDIDFSLLDRQFTSLYNSNFEETSIRMDLIHTNMFCYIDEKLSNLIYIRVL